VEYTFRVSQEAVGCANPKCAASIFGETACIVAGERRIVLLVKYGELDSIEASNTSFSGDPEVSIAGLKDMVDTILRKSVFTRPGLMPPHPRNGWLRMFTALLRMGPGVCVCDSTEGQEKHGK
jgi:hypothetical protein